MTARAHVFLATLGLALVLLSPACSVGLLNDDAMMLRDQGNQANLAFDGPMPVGTGAWLVRNRFGEVLKKNPRTDAEWIWEMQKWEKERQEELRASTPGTATPRGSPHSGSVQVVDANGR
ncbi:MAG: hypothetical protein ACE5H3_02625 [Planctomycetota bacterium]